MNSILFDNCICSMKRLFYLGDNSGHFSIHVLNFPDMIKKQIIWMEIHIQVNNELIILYTYHLSIYYQNISIL